MGLVSHTPRGMFSSFSPLIRTTTLRGGVRKWGEITLSSRHTWRVRSGGTPGEFEAAAHLESSKRRHTWRVPSGGTPGEFQAAAHLESSKRRHTWRVPSGGTPGEFEAAAHLESSKRRHTWRVPSGGTPGEFEAGAHLESSKRRHTWRVRNGGTPGEFEAAAHLESSKRRHTCLSFSSVRAVMLISQTLLVTTVTFRWLIGTLASPYPNPKSDFLTKALWEQIHARHQQNVLENIQRRILEAIRKPAILGDATDDGSSSSNNNSPHQSRSTNNLIQPPSPIRLVKDLKYNQDAKPVEPPDSSYLMTQIADDNADVLAQQTRSYFPSCSAPRHASDTTWMDPGELRLFFDISNVIRSDGRRVVATDAKLWLYKESLPLNNSLSNDDDILVTVYTYTRPLKKDRECTRAVTSQRLAPDFQGWVSFSLTCLASSWLEKNQKNNGIKITVEKIDTWERLPTLEVISPMNCSSDDKELAIPGSTGSQAVRFVDGKPHLISTHKPTLDLRTVVLDEFPPRPHDRFHLLSGLGYWQSGMDVCKLQTSLHQA
ncbi:unnamed protein product [Cyprideis torosa]|uniref:TGF-beta propeptide domain-containing protein n=1 Tax=Cyprideis torosa TaxID=163714 RepID=A0A7R8ZKP7_9CRUS|nr:unnamed protein product [Cyprideis torosa]CAG0884892.1 unnamed protein product [Cyprideis torosa]